MSAESEHFIELVTKPIRSDHEMKAKARRKISSKLKPEMDDQIAEASKRLETSDRSKWKPAWLGFGLVLFGMGLLGLSVANWFPSSHTTAFILGRQTEYSSEFSEKFQDELKTWSSSRLKGEELLLSKGKFKELQALHPDDPLYLAPTFKDELELAIRRNKENPLTSINRISEVDPDNGLWPYLAAFFTSLTVNYNIDPANSAFLGWDLKEQGKVDLMFQLYRQAAEAPRFDSYYTEVASRTFAFTRPPDTVLDSISEFSVNGCFLQSYELKKYQRRIPQILALQIRKLADDRNTERFKALLHDWIRLSKAEARNYTDMNSLPGDKYQYEIDLLEFLKGAQALGLHEESKALEESKMISDLPELTFCNNKDYQEAFVFHGSFLTSLLNRNVPHFGFRADYFHGRYPPMTIERLKPNRRSEHAFIAQLMILPLSLLLLMVSACLFALGFGNGSLYRQLAGRFAKLFNRSDWLHCLGFGILLPVFYFAILRYFTPFGGLDWYVPSHHHDLECGRFLLLFLLIISCSLLVLRRRLKERMSFFESCDRSGKIGIILTIAGFAVAPLLGSCSQIKEGRGVVLNMALIYPCMLAMGTLSIWLIALAIRFMLGNRAHALRRQILARQMAFTLIWAFALVCATIPLHHLEEKFWMKRDTVFRASPEHPAESRYKGEVLQQTRSELLEIFAPLDRLLQ